MFERKSPEEKIQRDFEKAARKLGEVLVAHYCETSDISPIAQTYVWQEKEDDNWSSGGWYLKLSHPNLGQVEIPMREDLA